MPTGFFRWSKTPASNATATYNMAEGMAPSAVNDGIRGIMSDAAQWRDDIGGLLATATSSSAYTLATNSVYDTLLNMHGSLIAFTPHATNTNTAGTDITLAVDGLAAKPIRAQSGVPLPTGSLILGTPYICMYNNTDGVFYLHNMTNPYNVPLGSGMDYWLPTAPNSSFVFPTGQAISRTTYAALFAGMGTTFGVGDGTTTFNLPNKSGKVSAMKEASASWLTSTYFGNSTVLGTIGGLDNATATLPAHVHGVTDPTHTHSVTSPGEISPNSAPIGVVVGVNPSPSGNFAMSVSAAATGISIQSTGSGTGVHTNVQPTIICNYIIRVI